MIDREINDRLSNAKHKVIQIENWDVQKAVKMLKTLKSDSEGILFSDHIIHAGDVIHPLLSRLFNSMVAHCYTPQCLLDSTIVSILKDIGDMHSSVKIIGELLYAHL